MKRQGLRISINELRELADELECEYQCEKLSIGFTDEEVRSQSWILGIVNKTPGCSDTWEFE